MSFNDKANHQQNLSINSLNSIVEPLTPPDLSEQAFNSSLFTNNSNGPSTASTTPLSNLNTNIGGNTYRSRFKSLPLVTELDQKFNQFNINNLQSLSAQHHTKLAKPDLYQNVPNNVVTSSNSTHKNAAIPQISLQQYHLQNQQNGTPVITATNTQNSISPGMPQRQRSQPILFKHQNQSSSSSYSLSTISSPPKIEIPSYKNYDELNSIPIESLDILKLSVDQYGCRFLQKKLDLDVSIKDIIFNKVFNNLIDLIIDPFGNYLVQKLIDHLSSYQKDLMIEKIHTCLFLISINQYGTRSLQKIIEKISNTYQIDLVVKGLQMSDSSNEYEDNNIVKLIKDLNGNHVIQKCIFKFPPEKFQFIIDSICLNNNIVRVSTHKHGCCVLQKLLNNATFNQILKISNVLLVYLDDLVNDQFGNYIIQFLFELNFLKSSNNINFLINEFFQRIYGNLIQLSCLKFSSNVVEKFIKILKFKQNYVYLTEIIKLVDANFELLIKDKFGNYVIQTLIDQFYDVSELGKEMNSLIMNIKNCLPVIKSAPYARKIQLKIQQLETNYKLHLSSSSVHSFDSASGFQIGYEVDQRNSKIPYHMNYIINSQQTTDPSFIQGQPQFIYPSNPNSGAFMVTRNYPSHV